jgi:hypothetical protein
VRNPYKDFTVPSGEFLALLGVSNDLQRHPVFDQSISSAGIDQLSEESFERKLQKLGMGRGGDGPDTTVGKDSHTPESDSINLAAWVCAKNVLKVEPFPLPTELGKLTVLTHLQLL